MQKFMGKLCFQGMHLFQTKNFIWQMVSLKKYEIVKDNFKEIYGIKVYKIRALKDIKNRHQAIKKGDLGGYVESERNLSQYDGKSCANLSPTQSLGIREPVKA